MKIEKGVPIPLRGGGEKFPLDEMEIGDSFLIPIKTRMRLQYYTKKLSNKKFVTKTVDKENVRCWRVE